MAKISVGKLFPQPFQQSLVNFDPLFILSCNKIELDTLKCSTKRGSAQVHYYARRVRILRHAMSILFFTRSNIKKNGLQHSSCMQSCSVLFEVRLSFSGSFLMLKHIHFLISVDAIFNCFCTIQYVLSLPKTKSHCPVYSVNAACHNVSLHIYCTVCTHPSKHWCDPDCMLSSIKCDNSGKHQRSRLSRRVAATRNPTKTKQLSSSSFGN